MAAKQDITIKQGADFVLALQWQDSDATPIDLTGHSIRMQVRTAVSSPTVALELTTDNNRIVITDAVNGMFELRLGNAETSALNIPAGVYDIEIVSPTNIVDRVLQGRVFNSLEVTR